MAWFELTIIIVLVLLSGLFSGLTLGLMSLSTYGLRRKIRLGNDDAEKIYPLRRTGNLLHCTLLAGNALVNSVLAVYLGSIAVGVVAVIVSTALITIFGEIVPQAVISRNKLTFGRHTRFVVYVFLVLLYPVTKPIAWVLDKTLGQELPSVYSKKELRLILEEQKELDQSDVDEHEAEMAAQSLSFSEKTVSEVMTPWKNVFWVGSRELLTESLLEKIKTVGHSRIPVYDGNQVIGMLYTKDLVSVPMGEGVTDIMRRNVRRVKPTDRLGKVLSLFKREKMHMFIVKQKSEAIGVITLEDVIEEITGEIVDEYDRFVDMRRIG